MKTNRRQNFLQTFLGALGAEQIHWIDENENSISGTVIYDIDDPEELQDFIWHANEDGVPSEQVITLIKFLEKNNLLRGDKIIKPSSSITVPGINDKTKEKLLDALFNVIVNMIDDGEETDVYFIHE